MQPPHPFAATIKKLEELPGDNGHMVDTLAGGLLRLFYAMNELRGVQRVQHDEHRTQREHNDRMEAAYRDVRARLAMIEERAKPPPLPPETKRTTYDGKADTRGGTAASRVALRAKREER